MPESTYQSVRTYSETVDLPNADSVDSGGLPVRNHANIGIGVEPSGLTSDTLEIDLIGQLEEGGEWVVLSDSVVADISSATLGYGAIDLKSVPAVAYAIRLTVSGDQTAHSADIDVVIEYPH